MDPDEMMRAIEQVASQTEHDQRTADIEAYIRYVSGTAAQDARARLLQYIDTMPEPTKSELRVGSIATCV